MPNVVYCAGFWPLKAAYFLTKSVRIRRRLYSKRQIYLTFTILPFIGTSPDAHLFSFLDEGVPEIGM